MASTGFTLPKGTNSHLLLEKSLVSWTAETAEEEKGSLTVFDTYDHLLLRKRSAVVWGREGLRRLDTRSFSLGSEVLPQAGGVPGVLEGTLTQGLKLPLDLGGRRLPAVVKLSVLHRTFVVRPPATGLVGDTPLVSGRLVTLQGERFLMVDTVPDPGTLEVLAAGLRSQGALPLAEDWFADLLIRHGSPVFRPVVCQTLVPSTLLGVRTALASLALGLLDNARYFEPGVVKDIDHECVHQYRLLVRKLRSLVGLCRSAFPPEDYAFLADALRKMGAASANLRDLDLQLEAFPGQKNQLPEAQAALLNGWQTFLAAERKRVWESVCKTLGSPDYQDGVARIERFWETWYKAPAQAGAFPNVGALAFDCLEKTGRKVRRGAAALKGESADEDYHQLRIGLKKLRYLLEFFEALYPARERGALHKAVLELLTSLGEFQDSSVRISQLMEGVRCPSLTWGPDEHFAVGMLAGILTEQHRRMKKQVFQKISRFRRNLIKDLVKACSAAQTGVNVK